MEQQRPEFGRKPVFGQNFLKIGGNLPVFFNNFGGLTGAVGF